MEPISYTKVENYIRELYTYTCIALYVFSSVWKIHYTEYTHVCVLRIAKLLLLLTIPFISILIRWQLHTCTGQDGSHRSSSGGSQTPPLPLQNRLTIIYLQGLNRTFYTIIVINCMYDVYCDKLHRVLSKFVVFYMPAQFVPPNCTLAIYK